MKKFQQQNYFLDKSSDCGSSDNEQQINLKDIDFKKKSSLKKIGNILKPAESSRKSKAVEPTRLKIDFLNGNLDNSNSFNIFENELINENKVEKKFKKLQNINGFLTHRNSNNNKNQKTIFKAVKNFFS